VTVFIYSESIKDRWNERGSIYHPSRGRRKQSNECWERDVKDCWVAGRGRRFVVEEMTKVKGIGFCARGRRETQGRVRRLHVRKLNEQGRLVVSVVDFQPHGIFVILILPS
jgi:hypothetical protein